MREIALQKVMKIRLFDIESGKLQADLRRLNESTFTNGQETVYLTNGDGVNSASFDHSKSASIGGANSRISGDLTALQVGSDAEELVDSTEFEYREVITIDTNTGLTKYVATGTAGSEIKYMYELDANGNKTDVVLEQGAIAAAGTFAYDTATKTITTSSVADGTKFAVVYYPTASKLEKITNTASKLSWSGRAVADCLGKDVCTDQIIMVQIVMPKAHLNGAFEWSLSEGGNPTAHSFTLEALETCEDEKLWDMLVVDDADLS